MNPQTVKKRTYLKPWIFGITAGAAVVLAEAFGGLYPPAAYAFCLTCHTRDLVNGLVNTFFGTSFQTSLLAHRLFMVTSPSVLVGAFLAARLHGEYEGRRSGRPLRFFLFGFTVMITGILIFGCPTRIAIRTGYGDLYGIAAFAAMLIGVFSATLVLRRRWTRRT